MQYMIIATETSEAFASRSDPERATEYWSAWSGYIDALERSGILVAAGGLEPPDAATTIRVRDGRLVVQDGPYADTKEQLGGYFVVDVADLDEALTWAERCPSAGYASVELRPLLPPMA